MGGRSPVPGDRRHDHADGRGPRYRGHPPAAQDRDRSRRNRRVPSLQARTSRRGHVDGSAGPARAGAAAAHPAGSLESNARAAALPRGRPRRLEPHGGGARRPPAGLYTLAGRLDHRRRRSAENPVGKACCRLRRPRRAPRGNDGCVRRGNRLGAAGSTARGKEAHAGACMPVGGPDLVVMAGPCAVESEQQILTAARGVAASGASLLRGGAFKPRTSPYDFQGLRQKGLELLAKARAETGLKIVTEVKDTETLATVAESADLLQIGARNMQNFSLLEAVGDMRKPVLLKRGMSSTIKELLMAAEYIVSRGNKQVILCERGIRTFETMTRNTLDLNAVPILKRESHLPVIVDPSHGIGIRSAVLPMARAAVACGADGLIIEVHPDPDRALSDGMQSLNLPSFEKLMREVEKIAAAMGRSLYRVARA